MCLKPWSKSSRIKALSGSGASSFSQAAGNWAGNLQAGKRQIGIPRAGSVSVHPRRPRGSQLGREKRCDESFQARAEEPMDTDSHRTISKRSSECWLLIGHKNALYYFDQSANSFSWVLFVFLYTTAIISPQLPPWFSCLFKMLLFWIRNKSEVDAKIVTERQNWRD